MSYSSFSIEEVEIKFDLNIDSAIFLPEVELISPSFGLSQSVTVEPDEYPLLPIDRILGILHWLVEN